MNSAKAYSLFTNARMFVLMSKIRYVLVAVVETSHPTGMGGPEGDLALSRS